MPKSKEKKLNRPHQIDASIINDFWNASPEALFKQAIIKKVLGCSDAKLERDRWQGTGIPFIKLSKRCVLYRKADILAWLDQHKSTQYSKKLEVSDA